MKFIPKITPFQDKKEAEFYQELKELLGFRPKNRSLYRKAFIHRSMNVVDDKGDPVNYERLEFLGDAVLGAVIAAFLFKMFPNRDEGYLTQIRSKIVSREHLNDLGKTFNLIRFVRSKVSKNRIGPNIYGNIFEALIGAIYLDKGYASCKKFIEQKVLEVYIDLPALVTKITSYKGIIIEWCQKTRQNLNFETYEDSGNQSVRHYSVKLTIGAKVVSKGRATSKKKAEEIASKRLFFIHKKEILAMLEKA